MPGRDRSLRKTREFAQVIHEPVETEQHSGTRPILRHHALAGIEEALAGIEEDDPQVESVSDLTSAREIEIVSRLVLDTVREGIFCMDAGGITTFVNPASARMLGWTSKELLGRRQHDIVHHSYPDGSAYPIEDCPINLALLSGRAETCEDEVFWRRDGSSFAVAYSSTPIIVGGAVSGTVVVFRDISERTQRDQWHRRKDAVFQAITTHQPLDATLQLLADAYVAFRSKCSMAVLLPHEDQHGILSLVASAGLSLSLKAHLQSVRIEPGVSVCGQAAFHGEELLAENGVDNLYVEVLNEFASRCLALPMTTSSGQILGVVAFLIEKESQDQWTAPIGFAHPVALCHPLAMTEYEAFRGIRDFAQIAVEHCKLQSELVHQSKHDRLTGLPNSLLVEERLNQFIRTADRSKTLVAVCSIDLDRFRRINENFGHIIGDELLQQIALRFKKTLRNGDTLGRQGGDEFTVLIPDLNDPSDAETICRKLLLTLHDAFLIDGKAVSIAANIGISIYPDHANTAELLLQHADTALDFAKEKGNASLKIFRPDLGQKVRQIAAREAALQTALRNNELYLMYQPLFDANRQIHGFEALLRWQHPEFGNIPPDQFIPLAEQTGLILPIGDWVLREACRQAMSWTVGGLADTKIFINISALQLGQADFTHSVSYAVKQSGLPPARLELEVTESFIVPSFKKATQRLQPLQDLGVSIAIDDFGTGHSSFSVLHKLPIDTIKVDRSFISRIDKDPSGLSTVRAIVNLAHQLGMKTVGEGVETEEQFSLLNDMGCEFYQGYLLSRPLNVDGVHQAFAALAGPVATETPVKRDNPTSSKTTELKRSA